MILCFFFFFVLDNFDNNIIIVIDIDIRHFIRFKYIKCSIKIAIRSDV